MKTSDYVKSFISILSIIILIINDLFGLTIFNYFDELLEILLLCFLFFINLKNKKIEMILLLIFEFLLGLIGYLLSSYTRSLFLVVEDFILIFKFPIVFMTIFEISKKNDRLCDNIFKFIFYLSILMSCCLFPVCVYKYITFGGKVSFMDDIYPGITGLYAFIFSYIIYFNYNLSKKNKLITFLLIITNFIVALTTGSTISIILFLLVYTYILWVNIISKKIKIGANGKLIIIIVSIFLVVFVSYEKILNYFFNDTAPRFLFYNYAFKLANSSFPFGVGFSLFGGSIAGNHYSPLYYDLGFNEIWTLNENSQFLIDTFFPTILGELGYIGTIVYLYIIFTPLIKIRKKSNSISIFKITYFAFICSGFTSNFMNSSVGIIYAIFLIVTLKMIFIKTNENKGEIDNEKC